MSTTGRTADAAAALDVESAAFVRIVARADGDALAASGVLARALAAHDTPFQVSVGRTHGERTARAAGDDEREGDVTLVVGTTDAPVASLDPSDRSVALAACDLVRDLALDATPDATLALAGAFAAGVDERDPGERRPGVAVPTTDVVDGLAHSTLVRAPWSGDPDATRDAVAGLDRSDPDADRRLASLVALDAIGEGASEYAARAIERALAPHATPRAPFATIGGYADVLDAVARTAPGTGVALAIGHDVRDAALGAWRDHGRRAHAALGDASTGRYDGLFAVGIDDGPVETVARLAVTFRSPEPVVLALGDGEAGIAARDDRHLDDAVEAMARTLDRDAGYDVGRRRGYLRYDPGIEDAAVVAAARAEL